MAEIEKTVLVPYSAEKMFILVDDVAKYPEFLPWCGGTSVNPQDETITHATVNINYHHVKHSFSTENKRNPPELIEMTHSSIWMVIGVSFHCQTMPAKLNFACITLFHTRFLKNSWGLFFI